MLKFLKKLFTFRMTWKLRLKFFYFFAKIHASAHFSYDEKRKKVCHSFISVVYGSVWVAVYFIVLILILSAIKLNGSVVLHFVEALELTTIVVKALIICSLQIFQSKDIVMLINSAIGIDQVINVEYRKEVNIYSERFERLYNLKIRSLLLQFLLYFACYYVYVSQKGAGISEILLSIVVVYTQFSTALVSGIYFYGSLLFGYRSYYVLNKKLKLILRNVDLYRSPGTQIVSYCQACDELDKLSLMYSRVNVYIERINRLSVVQITGELLTSFIMIVSALFYTFYALLSSEESDVSVKSLSLKEELLEILNNVICCLIYCFEIYSIVYMSSAVIEETDKLSTHIHRSAFIGADRRFIRCVQQLSLKAFLEKPNIAPVGMFTIDKPLIIGIGATIGTYLVILIQFQLDRKK